MAGNDGYTKLLLHCDGIDTSTSFPDASAESHSVSAIATAQVDTAQKVFGTGSLLCDGNSDYLSVPDSSDWDFGSGDFTIDFRVIMASTAGSQGFITREVSGSSYFYIAWESGAHIRFRDYGGTYDSTFSWSPTANTWYHIAIVRSGNSIKCYVDGTQIGSTQTFSGSFIDRSVPLYIGAFPLANYWLNGWMDEVRYSKGIARWTTNFTPPTEAYSGDEVDIDETVTLDDSWQMQTNPAITSIDETVTLDDNWQIQTNPAIKILNETITLNDSWSISLAETINNATKIISHNPLVLVTDTNPAKLYTIDISTPSSPIWTGYTLTGAKNAQDIAYNEDTGYYYVACADGIVIKVEVADPNNQTLINLSDTDDLLTIDTLDEFYLTFTSTENSVGELYQIDERTSQTLNTNFYYNIAYFAPIDTDFNWIKATTLDTNFQYLANVNETLKTDFKWLPAVGTFTPIGREDFVITVNGSALTEGDLIMDSIVVTHTIDSESTAIFSLARNHDNINETLDGSASELTNQNNLVVIINGRTEFTGKVANIDCQYAKNTEYISVTAKSSQPATDSKNITVSLPSKDEDISIYDVLIQNPIIYNPYIDPSIDTETETPEFYKGIKVALGQRITQQQFRGRAIEYTSNFQGDNAKKIDDGTFDFKNDMTYFWQVSALNYVSPVSWAGSDYKYIGTSLSSVSADTWYLKGVAYWMQRLFDDKVDELGYYEIGEAPFKEVSVQNGQFRTSKRYEDKADGLYTVKEESYNYVGKVQNEVTITKGYTQLIADLEYEKLQSINGAILPKTTVDMQLSIDAYHYYNMALLNRVNVDNTTSSGIFNNSNGFPVSIKTITIDSKTMRVTLKTDNTKSQSELEEIDDRYPNEEDYITEAYEVLITEKYVLPSSRSSQGIGYNFLPSPYWKGE